MTPILKWLVIVMSLVLCLRSNAVYGQGQLVCPVALIMENGGYCSYYALECPDTPCTAQFPCGSQLGCTNNPDCIEVSLLNEARTSSGLGAKRRYIPRDLATQGNQGKNGQLHVWEADPKLASTKANLIKTTAIRYPFKNVAGKRVYAQVFFIYVAESTEAGKEHPEGVIACGHEIEQPPAGVSVTEVADGDVQRIANHCHIVTVGSVPYLVSTFQGTDPDQR